MDYAVAIPVITAVVEAIKRSGMPHRFLPLVSIGIGVAYSILANNTFNFATVIFGIILGTSAVGIYETVKKPVENVVNKIKK